MLLCMSSSLGCGEVGEDGRVDLPGDIAFEAAHDVLLGQPFGCSPGDVGACRFVVAHARDDSHVERGVGRAVAAAVEPVSVGATRARGDRCRRAQVGEGRFAAQPLGVVAGGDEQLASDLRAMPSRAVVRGAVRAVNDRSCRSAAWISSLSMRMRRASARSAALVVTAGSAMRSPSTRKAAQRPIRVDSGRPGSDSRS